MGPSADTLRAQHAGPETLVYSPADSSLSAVGREREMRAADSAALTATATTDSLGLIRSDSLVRSGTAESAADSLSHPGPYRSISPRELFGPQSAVVRYEPIAPSAPQPLAADPLFQLFLLLLAALSIRFIYRHVNDVRMLFARICSDSVSREQDGFDDRNNPGFVRFLHACRTIGMLFAGAVILRCTGERLAAACSTRIALAVSLALTAGCAALSLIQFGSLRLTGAITRTQPFVERLVHLRRTFFAAAFLGLIPVFLFYLLSTGPAAEKLMYIIVIEIIITAILFLKESLTLFISQKIPFLHWILYLCIVECLPISFIALMLIRR